MKGMCCKKAWSKGMANENLIKNNKGFSLVELIIVIAIVGILAGTSVSMINYLHYANMEAAVETVQDMLERQRITSMSKEGTWYLYIYKLSDGYYMKLMKKESEVYSDAHDIPDRENGIKICGNNIVISGSSGLQVTESDLIRIVYSRNGVFATGTDGTNLFTGDETEARILFNGNSSHNVTLYRNTGKTFVDEP